MRFLVYSDTGHPTTNEKILRNSYTDKFIDAAIAEENRFEEMTKGKKEDELSAEEKTLRTELSEKVTLLTDERNTRLREIGSNNSLVRQIIDLALLSNGMLKGKHLSDFIQRSISLIESEKNA